MAVVTGSVNHLAAATQQAQQPVLTAVIINARYGAVKEWGPLSEPPVPALMACLAIEDSGE